MKKRICILLLATVVALGAQIVAFAADALAIPAVEPAATLYSANSGVPQPTSAENGVNVFDIENSPAMRSGIANEPGYGDEEDEDAFADYAYQDEAVGAASITNNTADNTENAAEGAADNNAANNAGNAAANETANTAEPINADTGAADFTMPLVSSLACIGSVPLLLSRKK